MSLGSTPGPEEEVRLLYVVWELSEFAAMTYLDFWVGGMRVNRQYGSISHRPARNQRWWPLKQQSDLILDGPQNLPAERESASQGKLEDGTDAELHIAKT